MRKRTHTLRENEKLLADLLDLFAGFFFVRWQTPFKRACKDTQGRDLLPKIVVKRSRDSFALRFLRLKKVLGHFCGAGVAILHAGFRTSRMRVVRSSSVKGLRKIGIWFGCPSACSSTASG